MADDAKTAGQIAYEAYMAALNGGADDRWERQAPHVQGAFEASAKAVLDAAGGLVDLDGLVDDGFEGMR